MPNEYIEPRIAIDESDVGLRPIQDVSLAAIGLVGTFSKGPVNQIVNITGPEELITVFGTDKDSLTGYKSAIAALNQGACDLRVVRIGSETLKEAEKTFNDAAAGNSIKVTALTPGTWGNDILIAITSGTEDGTFRLVVVYGTKSETLDNLTLDNLGSVSSQFISVSKVVGAVNIPANTAATPLLNGDDGATTEDADYVGTIDAGGNRSGLKVLETEPVGIVLCAQQNSETIQNAVITHCVNASLGQGLRVGVLSTAQGLSPDQAKALTASLNTARAHLIYPWVEPQESLGSYVAPDGYYAGLLSVLASNQSPSNKTLQGILSTERALTDGEIRTLTLARITPISIVPRRGGFRMRNGINLSTDAAWSQTCIRRAADELEMEAYDAISWAMSEANTPELRSAVAAQLDALLLDKKQKGEIYDFKPTICNDSNNTAETIAQRILNAAIRPRFTYPADYVDLYVQRQIDSES